MQEFTGNWNPALLFRRPLFCLLDRTFKWIERSPEGQRRLLSDGVCDEAWHLLIFAPLTYTDMGAPLTTTVCATDASGGSKTQGPGLGACEAEADPVWAGSIYRKAEGKGCYTKLQRALEIKTPGLLAPPGLGDRPLVRAAWISRESPRDGDVVCWWARLCEEAGVGLQVERYELGPGSKFSLTDKKFCAWLGGRLQDRKLDWLFVEPTARSFETLGRKRAGGSRAGPPPLRTPSAPRGREDLTEKQVRRVKEDELEAAACCQMLRTCEKLGPARVCAAAAFPCGPGAGLPGVPKPGLTLLGFGTSERSLRAVPRLERPKALAAAFVEAQLGKKVFGSDRLLQLPTPIRLDEAELCLQGGGVDYLVTKEERKLALETEAGAQLIKYKWRPIFSLAAKPDRHINLDEGKAYRFAPKRDALQKRRRRKKKVYLLDSGVWVGAGSKGRSSPGPVLCEQKSALPWVMGGRLYPQLLWIPSGSNPSDPLSRFSSLPRWLRAMRERARRWRGHDGGWIRDLTQDGDVEPHPGPSPTEANNSFWGSFVTLVFGLYYLYILFLFELPRNLGRPKQRRAVGGHLRAPLMLLLLLIVSWSPLVGHAGRMQLPRPQVQLREQALETLTTRQKYVACLDDFDEWPITHDHGRADGFIEADSFELGDLLISYFQWLWDNEKPYSTASMTHSALHDRWPKLKAEKALLGAGRSLKAWGRLEPSEFRRPWPIELLLALVSFSFLMGKAAFALAFWTLFHGCLRPGEVCDLSRRLLTLHPQLRFLRSMLGIITIPAPKTRAAFARMQHTLLDDQWLLAALDKLCAGTSSACRIFPSYAQLRGWLLKCLAYFGLSDMGYSLGGARAGGATFHYMSSFAVGCLQRRMRHVGAKTLDHYVQEAVAVLAQTSWSPRSHSLVARGANMAQRVTHLYITGRLRDTPLPPKPQPKPRARRSRSEPARPW